MMRGRREMRIGVMDLFLVLALVLSLVGGLLRWQTLRGVREQGDLEDYRLVLTVDEIDRSAADCIEVGEMLYDAAGMALGRVTALRREAAELRLQTRDGILTGVWPETLRCRLVIEISVRGSLFDGVLTPEGHSPLPIGETVTLFSRRLRVFGRVSALFPSETSKNGIFDKNV